MNFIVELVIDLLLSDFPISSKGQDCPKCWGIRVKPETLPDGSKIWHCEHCYHEWKQPPNGVKSDEGK
jgi:ribosomal protein L37AE/L43A